MSTTDETTSGVIKTDSGTTALIKQAADSDQFEERTRGVGPGQGISPPYNPEHLASLLELNGTHAASVQKKARREVGFGFEIAPYGSLSREDASDDEFDTVENFWHGPTTKWKLGPAGTPFATPEEVFEKGRQDWHGVGWAAFEILYAGADTEPQGLAYIPAQIIRQRKGDHGFVYHRDGSNVFLAEAGDRHQRHADDDVRYVDKESGNVAAEVDTPANEVLWIPNPHPNATNGYGIPGWIAELQTIMADHEARRFNRKRLENDLMLDYIITVEGGELTEHSRSNLREWLEEMRKSDEPELLYLEAEELTETSTLDSNGDSGPTIRVEPAQHFNDEDQSWTAFREKNKRDIAMSHEVPLAALGEHDATNTNTQEALRELDQEVIAPNQDRFEERLYRAIHQQVLDVTDWKVSFKTQRARDRAREADILATVMKAVGPALDINDVRELTNAIVEQDIEHSEELEGELFAVLNDPGLADMVADAVGEV